MSRTYDLVHRTTYSYAHTVTDSYGRTTMTPRDVPGQACVASTIEIEPAPADTAAHVDYFGNRTTYFGVTTPHTRLVVTARSTVEVTRPAPDPAALPTVSWQEVARRVAAGEVGRLDPGLVDLREALLPSPHVTFVDEVRTWAAPTFESDRPVVEVLVELAHRIRTELAYRSGSTTVHTTQAQLLAQKAGVCQDFAHLMIAALRLHGLPARYSSGYIETRPPAGRAKLRGADASHAWVSAWVPGAGWVEVDPTNDQLVDERYVLLGWGRDYDDVPPLRGVIFTEGSGSRLTVSVDLVPSGTDPFI
ncbi:transglutaminase family protein [Cellulomonas fengjieae]|uniref:Transglutaminase family protein n=1 Tax=Cellulomonas fengjieae TaxID=2819978 RepID=A0ABS3SME5_9CELL|nr:transglutaminase family protein [Cellulomonas fengjieae]MBO3086165.1 transglutaminase family protein [Cellulomonas fengjieae]QVI65776.1 transglutaminase family protein [Cellulomonas fengjieae]